jgi:hypothetical protein
MSSKEEGMLQSHLKQTVALLVMCLSFLRLTRLSSSLLSSKTLTVEAEAINNRLAMLQLIRQAANRLRILSNCRKINRTRTKRRFKTKHLTISLERLFLLLSQLNHLSRLTEQKNKSHNQLRSLSSSSLKLLNSKYSLWFNLRVPL